MSIRVPWDKHEAAILLDGWLKIKEGIPRNEVVSLVSYQLRRKAVNQGITIDSVFRNTNGINFQLMSMASAFEATDMGKAPSKLFLEVADLYHNDVAAYTELMEEAMHMVESTSETKDSFIKYVHQQSPDKADKILSAVKSMEEFAIATKALTCSIFDVLSEETLSILRKKVLNHKFFIVRHKHLQEYSALALSLMEKFVSNTSDTSTIDCDEEKTKYQYAEGNQVNDENKQIENVSFADWITQYAGLSAATARTYGSALNTCNAYAFEQQLYSESITLCKKYDDFIIKYKALMNDEGFLKLSEMKHNYLVAALNKYHDYMSAVNSGHIMISEQAAPVNNDTFQVSSEMQKKCQAILTEEFDEGYRIGDYMHRIRFLSSYEERYGTEFSGDLDEMLKSIGQIRDGRVFFCEHSDDSLFSDIYSELEQVFRDGATSVYYDCIFEKYADRLASEMSIYTADTLKSAMQNDKLFTQEYRFSRMGIVKHGITSDTNGEVKTLLQQSHLPMTFDEIKKQLWYVTMEQIRLSCVQIPECVRVDEGTYFYAPNLYISAKEKIALINAMRSAIASKGYLVAKDLREIFRRACPSAAMDSEHYKDHAIREILGILLQDTFSFSSSVITEKGIILDYGQIFRSYAAGRERLTLAELDMLKTELGLPTIYWLDVFSEVIRIDKTEMVRKGAVQFDVTAVDQALDEMCPDEYTPIKDFSLFLNLPPVSVRWNGFLLESYLREYSKKFSLVQLSVSKDDYYGLMLRCDSQLETYDDIAADMLARNNGWSDEKSALRLLVDMKFQPRARNKNISDLIKKAKQIRMNL